jgi:hypothetical protein
MPMSVDLLPSLYLTTRQAAAFLHPSPRTLERFRVDGTGPQFSQRSAST